MQNVELTVKEVAAERW